ncbi:response regulator [Actinoplanes sp. DH11]|uniref:response regulator n=1 Tax=Actinoplanes sp. DH11 TaxID=2857011 RepID=UPI001E2B80FA|nr:response regulator [Actinoplanes sp. DH11]
MNLDDVALLVTDVVLRDHAGPAVAQRLRARRPGLAVLYMSGYSEAHLRDRYGLNGSDPLVHKPFTAAELLTRVGDILTPAAH